MQIAEDNELSEGRQASKKIVIVEDNQALAEIYKTRLELIGYTCYIGYNGITGLYFIQEEVPDLVLLDLMIPDISGSEALAVLRRSAWGKDVKVVVISNLNESEASPALRELGIEGYFIKANMTNDQIDQIVNDILRPGWRMAEDAQVEAKAAAALGADGTSQPMSGPVSPAAMEASREPEQAATDSEASGPDESEPRP